VTDTPSQPAGAPPSRRRTLQKLPTFTLYGEVNPLSKPVLHIESIDARSRLHDWEIDAHLHRGLHQMVWLHVGTVDALLDGTRARSEGPALVVIPPGVAHAFRFSRQAQGHVLTFNAGELAQHEAAALGDALGRLFAAPRVVVLDRDAPEVRRLDAQFHALHAEAHAGDSADGPVPVWLARALVWRLAQVAGQDALAAQPGRSDQGERPGRGDPGERPGRGDQGERPGRAAGPTARRGPPLYTRWVVLLESHYREHWPVSRYAATLGLSTERLNRLVRAEAGHTAQHLIHARLAREATRQLVHVAAPVSKLAFELGFEDPAYFCRFFKRHTGLSPRAYRAQAWRDTP